MNRPYRFALILLCASAAGAQTYSAHSGWSFTDTIESMTDVVVGDIVSHSQSIAGSQVIARAHVRVVRVLQGEIQPGTDLALTWEFQSLGPPSSQGDTQPTRALWFLRKKADSFEPLRTAALDVDGSNLGLPSLPLPAALSYPAEQPVQTKIARELAWAMQDLAAQHPVELTAPAQMPVRGPLPGSEIRQRFQSLSMTLSALDKNATLEVYRYLSSQSEPHLRLLGFEGRINAGNLDAVFELEKDLPRLSAAAGVMPGPPAIMGVDLSGNLPAAHAFARIALSDTTLPDWEGALAMSIAGTHSLEFIPYLNVMLDSPRHWERASALMAFCSLLRPVPGANATAAAFWQPTMADYCPDKAPMNDTAAESRDIAFWWRWYGEHLEDIRKVATLPQVIAPSRYSAAPPSQEITEIPMEMRFQAVVSSIGVTYDHYHDASGAIVASAPPEHEIFGGNLNPSDREVFHKIVDATRGKLEQLNKSSADLITAARTAGVPPDRQKLEELESQRQAALKSGLFDLQNQLSPAGWKTLESEMNSMAIGATRIAMPKQE